MTAPAAAPADPAVGLGTPDIPVGQAVGPAAAVPETLRISCPYLQQKGSPGYPPWFYCNRRADQVKPGQPPCTIMHCRTFAAICRKPSEEEPAAMPPAKHNWDAPPNLALPDAPTTGTLWEHCRDLCRDGRKLSSVAADLGVQEPTLRGVIDRRTHGDPRSKRRQAKPAAPPAASPAFAVGTPDIPVGPAVAKSPAVPVAVPPRRDGSSQAGVSTPDGTLAAPDAPLDGSAVAAPTEPQIAALLIQHHLDFIVDTGLSREFMAYTAGRARELRNHAT